MIRNRRTGRDGPDRALAVDELMVVASFALLAIGRQTGPDTAPMPAPPPAAPPVASTVPDPVATVEKVAP